MSARVTIIALIAIAFAAVQWGSRDVRFGVTILFVAFVAFLAGRRRWGLMPSRDRTARYEDLVEAETRALGAEEELIAVQAEAQRHVRALLHADKRPQELRVRERDAALEWLHDSPAKDEAEVPPFGREVVCLVGNLAFVWPADRVRIEMVKAGPNGGIPKPDDVMTLAYIEPYYPGGRSVPREDGPFLQFCIDHLHRGAEALTLRADGYAYKRG